MSKKLKEMPLPELIKLLLGLGAIGKEIWDELKNDNTPRLKWRKLTRDLIHRQQEQLEIQAEIIERLEDRVKHLEKDVYEIPKKGEVKSIFNS